MIQSEGKKRNHPNVFTEVGTTNTNIANHREESKGNPSSKSRPEIGRILKTIAAPISSGVPTKEATMLLKRKHCILHNMPGHDISECRAFESMTVGKREGRERSGSSKRELPLRLTESHSQCLYKVSITCSICGTERDPDLLQLSREEKKGKTPNEREPPSRVQIPEKSKSVNPKCTSI